MGTGLGNYTISYVDGLLPVAGASQPDLSFTFSPPNLVLSWPTNAGAFGLISASNLAPSTIWTPVPSGVTVIGAMNTITIHASSGSPFYKLVSP